MWSPRRLLILVGAFALFLSGYMAYAYFLGGIDGLPPLPSDYHPPLAGEETKPQFPPEPDADRKMRLAFGADCEEVKRNHKLDLRSKGWVVAAEKFDILPDGRVMLSPFSAAVFPKSNRGAGPGEINVVQCEKAILTLDRPVTGATELSNRKIIGIELRSKAGIAVINNRGTLEKNDDIVLLITGGPLFFDERRNLIWTEGFVKLVDKQSRPHPTQVTAKGLDIQLSRNTLPRPKDKKDDDALIELLALRANVEMHVWVDPASGFLASAEAATTPKAGEKSQLIIKTPGTFTYNPAKDLASFDSPTRAGAEGEVHVSREHQTPAGRTYDQLVCDQLVLQFRRKTAGPMPKGSRGLEKAKEIEYAQATSRAGKEVILTMDSEKLEAYGSELTFYAASGTDGAKTVLKGMPMHAVKEGHKVEAVELHLIGEKSGGGHRVAAIGPGRIDLYDKTKDRYALHATWKKGLTSSKEREGDKVLDVLTLTGDAGFLDDEHGQELHGERLIVWLDAPPKDDPASRERKRSEDASTVVSRQKPLKIEAYENVRAESPEFRVIRSEHLEIRFVKEGATGEKLPAISLRPVGTFDSSPAIHRWGFVGNSVKTPSPPGTPGGEGWGEGGVIPLALTPSPQPSPPEYRGRGGLIRVAAIPSDESLGYFHMPLRGKIQRVSTYPPQLASPDPTKKRKPIELEARRIVVYVSRGLAKDELKELVSEGAVRVRRQAEDPKDKGVDIQGEMLNLLHQQGGDILYVFGDSRKAAQLQLGELIVAGPKVTINQRDNTASVNGAGGMSMPAGSTTFDGSRPSRPGSRVTIYWNNEMLFNGQYANFYGGVMAHQDTAYLKCMNLQVKLDREVSFKEGQKGPSPKVDTLICELKVYIQDELRDASNRYIHHHRAEATQLHIDNLEGKTIASGPGKVYSLSRGSPSPNTMGKGTKGAEQLGPMMLTRIDYTGQLFSKTQGDDRLSTFRENIEVFHFPADRPDAQFNPDRPPKDGFYLRCDRLDVLTRKRDGKTTQIMQAQNRVLFRTQEFFGRADVIKYDEAQDQVIFEGNPGSPAILSKIVPSQGQENANIKAAKILYNRRQGTFQLDGGKVISSW